MSILNLKNILQGAPPVGFFVSKDMVIHGDIHTASFGRIDGTVEGNIRSENKLVVGEPAFIKGDIDAMEILVFGTVEGNINCSRKAVLANTARVKGQIQAATMEVEEGAVMEEPVTPKRIRAKMNTPLKNEPVTAVSQIPAAKEDNVECWF